MVDWGDFFCWVSSVGLPFVTSALSFEEFYFALFGDLCFV